MKKQDEVSTIMLVVFIIALIAGTSIFMGAYGELSLACMLKYNDADLCFEITK